ncbi:hypothetical protein SUNI508_05671 [Seiridium unicorne]|uniref:Uncharacterized protein n=1 Tax=Seiridium unicorne TaxID=138068 RepID=A0ABR2V4K0_9PEZI
MATPLAGLDLDDVGRERQAARLYLAEHRDMRPSDVIVSRYPRREVGRYEDNRHSDERRIGRFNRQSPSRASMAIRDGSHERVSHKRPPMYIRGHGFGSSSPSPAPPTGTRARTPAPVPVQINNYIHTWNSSSNDDSSSDTDSDGARRKSRRRGHKHRRRHDDTKGINRTKGPHKISSIREPSSAQGTLSRRGVQAVWDPSRNSDLTIHLKLPLQDDIDEYLEEFCRLRRWGDFASAGQYFSQNLKEHQDNPYVLIQYAEMLLEKKDYNSFSELERSSIFNLDNHLLDNDEGRFLNTYWKLMQVERARFKPPVSPEAFSIIPKALSMLHRTITSGERPVGSTQIKMLVLLLDMTYTYTHVYLQSDWLRRQLANLFPTSFYQSLYADLLRQGRIWDFHDIFISVVAAESPEKAIGHFVNTTDIRRPLQALIADWKAPVQGSDTLTNLALLDMLRAVSATYPIKHYEIDDLPEDPMAMSTSLAHSIIESDPEAMKSEPFINWMLTKVQFAILKDKRRAEGFNEHFESHPGIYTCPNFDLPEYIPVKTENPGWRLDDAAPEYRNPIEMVLKMAKRLGAYKTESAALRTLMRLSKGPMKTFEDLCTLQKSVQGDFKSYSHTLVSKYLIVDSKSSMEEFKHELRETCFDSVLQGCLNAQEILTMSLLLRSIEGEGPEARKAMDLALDCSKYIAPHALEMLEEKMPDINLKRLDRLKKTITTSGERKEAELGLRAEERERRVRDVPEFDEIVIEDRPGKTDELGAIQREDTAQEKFKRIPSHVRDGSLDGMRDMRRGRYSRQQAHGENMSGAPHYRKRYVERRAAREKDYEIERIREQLEELRTMQQTVMARQAEKLRQSENVRRREILDEYEEKEHDLKAHQRKQKELRKSRKREDLDADVRQRLTAEKMLEELKARAEEEQRKRVEKEAVERYKEQASEDMLREKQGIELMEQLREVRNDLQELRSRAEIQERRRPTDSMEPPPVPMRLPRGRIWRIKRRRFPPRVIQVDHPSSSDSLLSVKDHLSSRDTHSSSSEEKDGWSNGDAEEQSLDASLEAGDNDSSPSTAKQNIRLEHDRSPPAEMTPNKGRKQYNSGWTGANSKRNGVYNLRPTSEETYDSAAAQPGEAHDTLNQDHAQPSNEVSEVVVPAHDEGSRSNGNDEEPVASSRERIKPEAESVEDISKNLKEIGSE